jgi:hypothetical protein
VRWKPAPEDAAPTGAGVPDALAVVDAEGALIGWDESAAHAYLAERGPWPSRCDDDCAARGHIDRW